MRFGSLFAGIGGFGLGFERSGLTCAWQVEIGAKCNEVLALHWPDVKRCGDVKDVGRHNLKPVDLICGGFPCQGLSVAGRRAGLADERSGLWWEFRRVIEELRPRWVVIENVPGLLSSNGGRDMGAIVGALAELRYGWAYRVLDAQYFGVAQRRRRVFIVGCLGDRAGAAEVLFEPESLCWDPAPRREAGQKIATLLASGAGTSRPAGIVSEADFCVPVAWPTAEEFVVTGTLNSGGNDGGFRTESGEHPIVKHALSGHNQRNDPDGEHFVVAFDRQSGGDVRLNISEEHMSALQASQTPAVGQPLHDQAQSIQCAYGVRRLTPTEAERLQGFPDNWTAVNGMADTPRYCMLGNAVCVSVAEWIGRRIIFMETAQ